MRNEIEQAHFTLPQQLCDIGEARHQRGRQIDASHQNQREVRRAPVWCVATGKALLAHASADFIYDVATHLVRFTERTIVDRDELLEHLQAVRRNGFAVNHCEWREGVSGIAAPVRDSSGNVVAAIGISGPATRFRQKDIRPRAATVIEAANSISAALGYRTPARATNGSREKNSRN